MFDEHAVESPDEFRVNRPWREYLHFGHGLHECFGESLVRAHLPALATALLERGPVRRAPGAAGQLTWAGPFPSSLTVMWGGT
jgi:cytochrome P450